jgi:hypothetical protein
LYDALLQDGVQAPVIISGDVHMSQLMRVDCQRTGAPQSSPRALIEMTTSGMTHAWGTLSNPPISEPDLRPTWKLVYESLVARSLLRMLHYLCPWTDLMVSGERTEGLHESGGGEGSKQGLQFSLEKNFGELEFNWEERTVAMRSFGEGSTLTPLLMAKTSMDQLSGKSSMPGSLLSREDFHRENRTQHPALSGEWTCINHRGRDDHISHMVGHLTAGITLTVLVPMPLVLPSILMLFLIRRASRNVQVPTTSKLSSSAY